MGLLNPEKHDPESIAASIQSVIDLFLSKNSNKLVDQTYDGAAVMSGKHKGVHTIIKQKYPLAHFVHCYQLNLIISQAASQNTQVRVFLANVDDIVNFFFNFPQMVDVLNEIVERQHYPAILTCCKTNYKKKERMPFTLSVLQEHLKLAYETLEKTLTKL